MFHGSFTALITPFRDGSVDEPALADLVRFQLQNGTNGLVPVGTTGEAPTLSAVEYARVIEIVVHEVGGQVPVIAGAGSYDTAAAIANSERAAALGADAVLHVMGYYNRPEQEGVYQHFQALSGAINLPIVVYNIPPRTTVDIEPETMARLADLQNIIGVKDCTRDVSRPLRERLLIGVEFCFLTGEDEAAVAYNANGGQGCISVTANVAPALCSEMQAACAQGRFQEALAIQLRLMPLHSALFQEPSPAGVKYACSLLGLSTSACRLPIIELDETTKALIKNAMQGLGLI
ncbi:4-hydroxy-tetrahydrodipicolinate synthase [Ruegeria sp. EL01]|jgi:4-hydroxy-tetrahydrodipicolinate synthase|uniref:4-hydroxy-tetrahydrodipicolinate synthase n=1 Tax=Ruegeria sp. EL01 TaxID=2107578 RepID=UPI000EA82450|nr:4-hydroxy-tetrahydrodipicolinate synthase [Ruegeria sp. EL01]